MKVHRVTGPWRHAVSPASMTNIDSRLTFEVKRRVNNDFRLVKFKEKPSGISWLMSKPVGV